MRGHSNISVSRLAQRRLQGRDPRVFFHQIPVRHSRDVIAHGAMQSLGRNSLRRRLAQHGRIRQVRLENLPQHFAGAPIHFGDARIVINVLVQEFSQIAIRLEQIIAVTNQGHWLLACLV